jgi:deazaflavin-dependent oxidoreductase (nitroreductase family)
MEANMSDTNERNTRNQRIIEEFHANDGKRYVVIASKGGAPTNPDWYYNILAHPRLTVEVGTETFQVNANVAEEPDRTRLYNKMVEVMPGFDDYRRKTERVIPVIELTPVNKA